MNMNPILVRRNSPILHRYILNTLTEALLDLEDIQVNQDLRDHQVLKVILEEMEFLALEVFQGRLVTYL